MLKRRQNEERRKFFDSRYQWCVLSHTNKRKFSVRENSRLRSTYLNNINIIILYVYIYKQLFVWEKRTENVAQLVRGRVFFDNAADNGITT